LLLDGGMREAQVEKVKPEIKKKTAWRCGRYGEMGVLRRLSYQKCKYTSCRLYRALFTLYAQAQVFNVQFPFHFADGFIAKNFLYGGG